MVPHAEWAPHDAVWTAWPHDPEQWAEGLAAPRRALMAMVSAIVDVERGVARGERVELLVRDAGDEAEARALPPRISSPEKRPKTSPTE